MAKRPPYSKLVAKKAFERSTDDGRTWEPCSRNDVTRACGYPGLRRVLEGGVEPSRNGTGATYRKLA